MHLSVITINFNGSENTKKLLKSLLDQTDKDFSIIVVDNASEEADLANLTSYMGTIANAMVPMLIRNKDNLGFSGGNNVGLKEAFENSSDWALLLNNDTWADSGFISDLKAVLGSKKGLLGLAIDERDKIAYAGHVEWFKATLRHYQQLPTAQDKGFYIIGGVLAISRNAYNKIGGLDEKYFLYFEDADYSIKARKNNIPVEIVAKPIVRHAPSSTTKKLGSPLLLRYHYRNALYFNLKNGSWYVKILVWPWSVLIIIKQLVKISLRIRGQESIAILQGVLDFYFNKIGRIC